MSCVKGLEEELCELMVWCKSRGLIIRCKEEYFEVEIPPLIKCIGKNLLIALREAKMLAETRPNQYQTFDEVKNSEVNIF